MTFGENHKKIGFSYTYTCIHISYNHNGTMVEGIQVTHRKIKGEAQSVYLYFKTFYGKMKQKCITRYPILCHFS